MAQPNFDVRHPVFSRYIHRWRTAFDFWRGGLSVLSPSWSVQSARLSVWTDSPRASDGSASIAESLLRAAQRKVNSYLWPDASETDDEYEERCQRQIHLPLFSAVVNGFVNGILRAGCKRVVGAEWQDYVSDVDGAGTDIDSFVRQAQALTIVFGRIHAITDRPVEDGTVRTRRDERERGIRAYSYLVTPLDVIDWSIDERNQWRWVNIMEPAPDTRAPGVPPSSIDGLIQVRTWYPDSWELWRPQGTGAMDSSSWVRVGAGEHGAGEVPLSTCWASKDSRGRSMDCESPLADVLDMDRHFLNKMSELDEVDRAQAFALLAIPEADGGPPGPIDISPWRAMSVPVGGMPQYLSPDSSLSAGKWQRLQDGLFLTRQLSGVSRGRSEDSREERSGEAISLESSEKSNQMAQWAASLEKFDRDLFRLAAKIDGRGDPPRAEYPRNYDLKGTLREINELLQLNSTKVIPPEALVMLVRPVLSRMMRDFGFEEEAQQKILDSLRPVEEPTKNINESRAGESLDKGDTD